MNEIIKACIMYELSGRIFHKKHVLIPPIKVKIKSINFLTDLASAKPPRKGESEADKAKRKSFKARHAKNIAKGKMSAAFWADRTKWS